MRFPPGVAWPLSELLYKVTYLSTHVAIVQLNTKQTSEIEPMQYWFSLQSISVVESLYRIQCWHNSRAKLMCTISRRKNGSIQQRKKYDNWNSSLILQEKLHEVLIRKRSWKQSVPDDRVLCYDGSVRHIGRLAEEVRQRLPVRVREGLADDMRTSNIRCGRCVAVLHPDRGTLNSIQCRVQA